MDDWRIAAEVVPHLLSAPAAPPELRLASGVPRTGRPPAVSAQDEAALLQTGRYARGDFEADTAERGVASFGEAVATCFRKYVTFSGRANRPELWYFVLFNLIVSLALGFATGFDQDRSDVANGVWTLLTFLPSLAVSVRRLHDIGRSGWWYLIIFVPLIGAIVLIFWFAKRGEQGPNRFGPAQI
ncbi:hypothetical protein CLD20_02765 [Afifella sp. IM 167]|nr:hypothetical protein [Afifella sp. IM 167]